MRDLPISNYCPICGAKMKGMHRCPDAVLRGIDAANAAAMNGNDGYKYEEQRTYASRLKAGFNAIDPEYQ